MFKYFLVFIVVVLVSSGLVFAEGLDDQGNPNDSTINERANACFEGGSMEGKCNTTDIDGDGQIESWEIDWHYTCGWYLIRFEEGIFTRDDMPYSCKTLLPPEPQPELTNNTGFLFPGTRCVDTDMIASGTTNYVDFLGGNFLPTNTSVWLLADCTSLEAHLPSNIVYAPEGGAAADALCQSNGRPGIASGPRGDNIYVCQ